MFTPGQQQVSAPVPQQSPRPTPADVMQAPPGVVPPFHIQDGRTFAVQAPVVDMQTLPSSQTFRPPLPGVMATTYARYGSADGAGDSVPPTLKRKSSLPMPKLPDCDMTHMAPMCNRDLDSIKAKVDQFLNDNPNQGRDTLIRKYVDSLSQNEDLSHLRMAELVYLNFVGENCPYAIITPLTCGRSLTRRGQRPRVNS